MKILFFIETVGSGGKERRLVELLKCLKEYKDIYFEVVLTHEDIHYKLIHELDVKIHVINRRFKKDPTLFWKFFGICRIMNPDIIHVWGNMVAIYAIPAKVFLQIPMINSQIADAPAIVKRSLLNVSLPFFFSDLLIANSNAGRRAYNISALRCKVIYNGFDFSRINNLKDKSKIRESLGLKDQNVVGMVANITKNKDYITFLKAANIVLNERDDVVFLCIGNGDYSHLLNLIEKKHRHKVLFLGKQEMVESLINIFTIGVLSTFTEGISNSVMEYMALGKPAIVTLGGGSEELVENGVSGFLIPPKSPDILADKLFFLLDNLEVMHDFGVCGKRIIGTKFSLDEMTLQFVAVYNDFVRPGLNN